MYSADDIPLLACPTPEAARQWWSEIFKLGLNHHPDDDPAHLVRIDSGEPMLDSGACRRMRDAVSEMFDFLGDDIYRIGHEELIKTLGITLEAAAYASD